MDLPNAIAAGRTIEAGGNFAVDVATNVRSENAERVSAAEIRTDAYAETYGGNDGVRRTRRISTEEDRERGDDRRLHGERDGERGQRTRHEHQPTENQSSRLRDTVRSRSEDVRDNNYLGLRGGYQLEGALTPTDGSPDMFCLAPVGGDENRAPEGGGRHRDRSLHRRERRRSGGFSEGYRRKDTLARLELPDKRER